LIDGECKEMERKTREMGDDSNLVSLDVCVATCSFIFPTLTVFKVVYHEYPCAFSVMSVRPQSQRIPRPLGLKTSYPGWMSMITSPEGPLFNLASGPSNPKSPTGNEGLQNFVIVLYAYQCFRFDRTPLHFSIQLTPKICS